MDLATLACVRQPCALLSKIKSLAKIWTTKRFSVVRHLISVERHLFSSRAYSLLYFLPP